METMIVAAGCFWGVEDTFANTPGVVSTRAGYSGGTTEQPTYRQVCDGETGHKEVVEVVFDPSIISYKELLEVFWRIHDPTSMDRQGADVGEQYRSVIYYLNEEQQTIAEQSKQEQSKQHQTPIVTEILPASDFYEAEEYHQKYIQKQK